MNYGSSYRLYGGYRLCECGCDITFTYTNFDSDGSFASGVGSGQLDERRGPVHRRRLRWMLAPGRLQLFGNASVEIDNYDIGFSKTIPLGCRLSCGGCGDCADCCDPCGLRTDLPRLGHHLERRCSFRERGQQPPTTTTCVVAANTGLSRRVMRPARVDFNGAGLRFGLLGRRYFGRQGRGQRLREG